MVSSALLVYTDSDTYNDREHDDLIVWFKDQELRNRGSIFTCAET